jgi:hypothetical protein
MKRLSAPDVWAAGALVLIAGSSAFAGKEAGGVVIRDEPTYWDYVYPELVNMHADVAKFHLNYNNDWAGGNPAHFVIPSVHISSVINAGVKDIILRSADTHISRNEVNWFINGETFWDTGEKLVDFIYNHRNQVHCWVELGNEPDNNGADPWIHRWNLIDCANNIQPTWTWLWTMHWIASAPAASTGSYPTIFYTVDGSGSVQAKYEGLGAHEYANQTFTYGCTNLALSKLRSGGAVWITEAGLNYQWDWGTKGSKYKLAIQSKASDARIRGWTFFTIARDPYWNTCPNPDGTCLRYGIDLTYNTTNIVPGFPCAAQIALR